MIAMREGHGQAITIICSPEGNVLEVLLDELGIGPRLTTDRSFAGLFESDYQRLATNFLLRAAGSNSLVKAEFQVVLQTGSTSLYCCAYATARGVIVYGGSQPLSLSAVNRRLRALLRRSRARITASGVSETERLARAAHDLRNPIAGILAASEYLLDKPPFPRDEEQVKLLESIHASSRFLLQLVDDMLDVPALGAGEARRPQQATDIHAFLLQNLAIHQFLASRRDIRLNLTIDENPPFVAVDASRTAEVIDNLVGNAIKCSPDRGTIDIRLGRRDRMAMLAVRDQGAGIPAAEIHTLFEPFRKGSGKRNPSVSGTRLELSVVKRIVERYGGAVEIESEVGRGSTFTVLLPIADVETEPRRRSAGQGFAT